jgi:hypothetical protein
VLAELEPDVEALLVNRTGLVSRRETQEGLDRSVQTDERAKPARPDDGTASGASVHEHWLVPVDRCYALVGLIKTRWKGLAGGQEVWEELGEFFEGLRREAEVVTTDGQEVEA